MSQNPRYRVITDLDQIRISLENSMETVLRSNGDINVMAVVTNLGMIGEDLTDLGHTDIATNVNAAGKILFSYPLFQNNQIVDNQTITNVAWLIATALAQITNLQV